MAFRHPQEDPASLMTPEAIGGQRDNMALTKMQMAFVHEFVTVPGISQRQAAINAGCSVKRASATSSEWMRDPNIKREIDRRLTAKLETIEKKATSGRVTKE